MEGIPIFYGLVPDSIFIGGIAYTIRRLILLLKNRFLLCHQNFLNTLFLITYVRSFERELLAVFLEKFLQIVPGNINVPLYDWLHLPGNFIGVILEALKEVAIEWYHKSLGL